MSDLLERARARLCPHPIRGDDGSAKVCIANGHCGCDEKDVAEMADEIERLRRELGFLAQDYRKRAERAEAALATARRDALEEAATLIKQKYLTTDLGFLLDAIRALAETET